jgi:predicted GNAT family acetyltransferase
MTHPEYRLKGLAVKLLEEVDKMFPQKTKELYTCTKSWTNIRLYEKVGYKADREATEDNGLSFVYMRK